jgi:phosphatidylglycerol:prolipoprotein diacylglycerol transferase
MYSHFASNEWVTPFGLIFIAAIFIAWFFARRNASSSHIDPSHIDLLMPVAIIVGVAGGTLIAILMPADQVVAGAAMNHGIRLRLFSLLGSGAVALFIYSRMTKLPFRRLLDIFALPTLAGLMLHRVGCFLAGCCWGASPRWLFPGGLLLGRYCLTRARERVRVTGAVNVVP